jgi:hypothetical protein
MNAESDSKKRQIDATTDSGLQSLAELQIPIKVIKSDV